ncbi:MAG: CBS domain-containing protein [Pseudomonadales bacterium]|nr:CBS domain-containing protein [Pseudomonadales bacterium]
MSRTVREILEDRGRPEVVSVAPIATVYEAIDLMSSAAVGALPVVQEKQLVGIISERDYARKVILKERASKSTRVSEIMTMDVVTVSPGDSVSDCMHCMAEHRIRHLVVVDEGWLVGMLSLRDLLDEIIHEQAAKIDQLEHHIRGAWQVVQEWNMTQDRDGGSAGSKELAG